MRIDCIGVTTFGNAKSTTAKKVLSTAAAAVVGTTFVKGLSNPAEEVDEFIKANDDQDYTCDDDDNPDECCGWDYSAYND